MFVKCELTISMYILLNLDCLQYYNEEVILFYINLLYSFHPGHSLLLQLHQL